MHEFDDTRIVLTVTTPETRRNEHWDDDREWRYRYRDFDDFWDEMQLPWDDEVLTRRRVSRLAELPEYLAFAATVTLAQDWSPRARRVFPEPLLKELEAARAFARSAGQEHRQAYVAYEIDNLRRNLRNASDRLFAAVLEDNRNLERLRPSEYEHLRMSWREVRLSRRFAGQWVRSSAGLFGESVQIQRLTVASPAEIVFLVTGPLGVAFAIMVVAQWLASRARHDELDLQNKRIAAEAASVILDRLKRDTAPIPPEAIAAIITNARIAPVPLPAIADVKINIGAA